LQALNPLPAFLILSLPAPSVRVDFFPGAKGMAPGDEFGAAALKKLPPGFRAGVRLGERSNQHFDPAGRQRRLLLQDQGAIGAQGASDQDLRRGHDVLVLALDNAVAPSSIAQQETAVSFPELRGRIIVFDREGAAR
jgi:hypothetical protein